MKTGNGNAGVVVFDSFALIAFLKKEPASDRVKQILQKAERFLCTIFLHEINVGEIYCRIWKDQGEHAGKEALHTCLGLPITFVPADREFILNAAKIKATHKVSYADAFCIETARRNSCPIVTGDPEFQSVVGVKIIWIGK